MSRIACSYYKTDSLVDVTSVNFKIKKVHEIKFSSNKIYYNFSQKYPKITNA